MASYHLSVKTVKRSAGRSATAAAAYRSGGVIACDREGRVHDYSARHGVETCFILAPDAAPDWVQDRSALWNAAEARETRRNSVTAREWELALPAELGAEDRAALAHDFARALVTRYGIVADVALHAPHREGDQRNHHAHILTTTRVVSAGGLGDKTRVLDAAKTGGLEIEAMRELWAGMQNRALERAGQEARVDHRSLEVQHDAAAARGDVRAAEALDRAPEVKLGPAVSAMERRAQRQAEMNGSVYQPVTGRGAAVHAVRRARELVEQLRERVGELRAAYEQARDSGQGRVSAGLAALRAAAKDRGAGSEAADTGKFSGSDLRARLQGILGDHQTPDQERRQPGQDNPGIATRLAQILGRDTQQAPGPVPQPRNPQLLRALTQMADTTARGERVVFASPEQAKAFFADLTASYGDGILHQLAAGDDSALQADFADPNRRQAVARAIDETAGNHGVRAAQQHSLDRSEHKQLQEEHRPRGQGGGWEL